MSRLVAAAATELATRTSRRSFLARSSKVMLGVVGGGIAAALMASPAYAACDCGHGICDSTCPSSCGCSPACKAKVCYACPDCAHQRCCCTGITC
jgi:hypothetical protein